MEENLQTVSQPVETIEPVEQTPPPKPNNTLVLLLSFLLLILLSSTAFLYYQNQQLKNMLVSYQTPIVSPTPVSKETIYMNKDFNFQVTIPSEWEIRKDATGYVAEDKNVEENFQIAPLSFKEGFFGSIEIRTDTIDSTIEQIQEKINDYNKYLVEMGDKNTSTFPSKKEGEFNEYKATILTYKSNTGSNEYIIISRNNLTYVLFRPTNESEINYKIGNQILSTFRFTN